MSFIHHDNTRDENCNLQKVVQTDGKLFLARCTSYANQVVSSKRKPSEQNRLLLVIKTLRSIEKTHFLVISKKLKYRHCDTSNRIYCASK